MLVHCESAAEFHEAAGKSARALVPQHPPTLPSLTNSSTAGQPRRKPAKYFRG
jgi:hypothetical protein